MGRKAAEGARTPELLRDVTINTVTAHPVVAVGMGSYATTTGLLNDDPDQIGEGMAAVSGSFSYARAIGNPAYSVNVRVRGLPPVPPHIARQRGAVSPLEINIRRINNQYSGKTPHTENVIGKNNPRYNEALQERITARGQAASGGKTGVGRQGRSSGKPNVEQRIVEHGGGNWLSTLERIHRNIQETRKGNQSSRFRQHAQTEREVRTGIDFDHIIGGDITRDGKRVTGGHSQNRGDVRVIKQHGQPDKNGVTRATVEIRRPEGGWQIKTRRNGESMEDNTMFPKDWDNARIRAEVTSAWENRRIVKGDQWEGKSESGVWVTGYTKPRITAYPIYGRY